MGALEERFSSQWVGRRPMGTQNPSGTEFHLVTPNIKPSHKSVFDPENVPNHLIGEKIPFEIAHHLMHFDDHFGVLPFRKRNWLDVRIDHCPLPRPVTAYSFAPVDMTPFHAICPTDIFVQGGKHRLYVASIEAIVDSSE